MRNIDNITFCFSAENFEISLASPRAMRSFAIKPGDSFQKYCQENLQQIISSLPPNVVSDTIWTGDLNLMTFPSRQAVKHHCALSVVIDRRGASYLLTCRDIQSYQKDFEQLVEHSKLASIGKLTGDLAHEISNPLSIIIGRTDEALRKVRAHIATNAQLEQDLDRILQTSHRILKSIRAMRSFFNLTSSSPSSKVFVSQIIGDTINLISERFKYWNIDLEINQQPNLIIHTENCNTQQILLVLLLSAFETVKGKRQGKVKLEASASGHDIQFRVKSSGDYGSNTEPTLLDGPFYSNQQMISKNSLDFSIIESIIASNSGKLSIEESPESKSFLFSLPAHSPS